MKDCKTCGGSQIMYVATYVPTQTGPLGQGIPKPCSCLTDRLARLERVAEAAKDAVDDGKCWYDHNGFCQEHYCSPPCYQAELKAALTALEGDSNEPA